LAYRIRIAPTLNAHTYESPSLTFCLGVSGIGVADGGSDLQPGSPFSVTVRCWLCNRVNVSDYGIGNLRAPFPFVCDSLSKRGVDVRLRVHVCVIESQ
jgi:hypothetical protein